MAVSTSLQAVTKVKETVIRDFLFADDCAVNANTEQKMQNGINHLSKACDNFGLNISTKKTEVMSHPAYQESCIKVNE